MKDRRLVITTIHRCIDCPFLGDGPYQCYKANATFEGESEPGRGEWYDSVREGIASCCPLKALDIDGVATDLGIELEGDDIFEVVASFMKRMEREADSILKVAIEENAPRCPHAGSVVHEQRGGRVYNKKCPKCGIALIGRRQSRETGSNVRWVLYGHPNVPLRKSDSN